MAGDSFAMWDLIELLYDRMFSTDTHNHITIGSTYFRASEEDTVKITESISDAYVIYVQVRLTIKGSLQSNKYGRDKN